MVVGPELDGGARIALGRLKVAAAQRDVAEPREALGALTRGTCGSAACGALEQLERAAEPVLGLVELVPVEGDQSKRELRVVVPRERGGVRLERPVRTREVAEVIASPAEVVRHVRRLGKLAVRRSLGAFQERQRLGMALLLVEREPDVERRPGTPGLRVRPAPGHPPGCLEVAREERLPDAGRRVRRWLRRPGPHRTGGRQGRRHRPRRAGHA
jgi:hypothetical protein